MSSNIQIQKAGTRVTFRTNMILSASDLERYVLLGT